MQALKTLLFVIGMIVIFALIAFPISIFINQPDETETYYCGGFIGADCPKGYDYCEYPVPMHPDAQGVCKSTYWGKLKNLF